MDRLHHLVPPIVRRAASDARHRLMAPQGIERQPANPASFGTWIDERLVWLRARVHTQIALYRAIKARRRWLGEQMGLALPTSKLVRVPLDSRSHQLGRRDACLIDELMRPVDGTLLRVDQIHP